MEKQNKEHNEPQTQENHIKDSQEHDAKSPDKKSEELHTQKKHIPKEDDKDIKIADLTSTLKMLQADFENFRKRMEKEKEEFKEYAKMGTIAGFLPILDNFELAIRHAEKDAACEKDEFVKGVKMIYSQFLSTLESFGVSKIETADKEFDPKIHEAIMTDYSENEKGLIIEEFQAGYICKDRVIRHSKVKISKGPNTE